MLLAVFAGCSPAKKQTVNIRFIVSVPHSLDSWQTVHISGSAPQLGDWDGKGLSLTHAGAGTYRGAVDLPRGGTLEFKATLGSWDSVEKSETGGETPNRTVSLETDQTITFRVGGWRATGPTSRPSSITGDVRYHRQFHSKILGNDRTIIVWLPPGYENEKSQRYPVLYMQDGQNVFDDATSFAGEWHADETATDLILRDEIEPIIIVGVENAGAARADEYTPSRKPVRESDLATRPSVPPVQPIEMEGGNAEGYAQFLITEVKPLIDANYRTLADRGHTAVAGSSLGGLMSLYLGWKHGDIFGKAAAISPSLWWDHEKMLSAFETDRTWMRREKIWLDMGTDESYGKSQRENIADARELQNLMIRAGLKKNRDFVYEEVPGGRHSELDWSARFDQVLLFFFGK